MTSKNVKFAKLYNCVFKENVMLKSISHFIDHNYFKKKFTGEKKKNYEGLFWLSTFFNRASRPGNGL